MRRVLVRADANCQTHRVVTERGEAWFVPLSGSARGRRRIPDRVWRRCRIKRWVRYWASFKGDDRTYWQTSNEGHAALFAERYP